MANNKRARAPFKVPRQLHLMGGFESRTLTGAVTLTGSDPQFIRMDPGGADRAVTLPTAALNIGSFFCLLNSANADETLTVDTTLAVINQGEWAWMGVDQNRKTGTPAWVVVANSSGIESTLQLPDSGVVYFGADRDGSIAHDGTDGLLIDTAGELALNSSAGVINLGNDAVAQAVNLATGAAARVITIGNAASASLALEAGVGAGSFTSDTTLTLTAGTSIPLVSRVTTTDGVSAGTAKVVGGRAYTNTAASSAVTNTTTETLFDASYTMPADTLKAGSRVRIAFQGIATATDSTDTLAIKLYIGGTGGTALVTLAATDVADNDIFSGEVTLICRTAGTSGTFVASGWSSDFTSASSEAVVREWVASTAIDTTSSQVIGASAEWSVAATANSCRLDVLSVDIA